MAHVICLLNVTSDRASFTWSEGPASFEPYELGGQVFHDFKELASEARDRLSDLVKDYVYGVENVPQASYELAVAGHELYLQLFDPGAGAGQTAKQIRRWLEELHDAGAVPDTLEVVVDSPWALPWNVVYDREPEREAFLGNGDFDAIAWQPFWGIRYDLTGGRKVNPMRRAPALNDPKVLMVIDPRIRDNLPADQQQRLADFVQANTLKTVHSKHELLAETKVERPHLLYWLSHATPSALVLGDDEITPRQLRRLLRKNESDDPYELGGIAFLNACQTAESGDAGSFFDALHSVGFTGMVGTEHQTVDTFANPLGLDFLEAFLVRGEPLGDTMRRLRSRVPLGLVYGTYCPPDLHVVRQEVKREAPVLQPNAPAADTAMALGVAATASRTYPSLPADPYRSLAYYSYNDQGLFAGRDEDVQSFATLLDDGDTRIVVLHGESGVGKSSFLRAGVIPYLEDECLGYQFIREQLQHDDEQAVLFVRATNDLAGQLANAISQFCATQFSYPTPTGDITTVDLPGLLSTSAGTTDSTKLRDAMLNDPGLLGRVLGAIGDRLPFAPILVIDQGEEIFTLAQTMEDTDNRELALAMLRRLIHVSGDFKVVLSLRTEYYGRLLDRLRRGVLDTTEVREYLLTDFSEEALVVAIARPTASVPIPRSSEVPADKYGFTYADGVPEEIAQRVTRFSVQRRDSVLPLMQVICNQLYQRACSRGGNQQITSEDLNALGGIEGGMREHVEMQIDSVLTDRPSEKRRVKRLLSQLFIRQPDGSLSTALIAEDELARRWRGRMPFSQLCEAAVQLRLMRVNSLRIGGQEERRYVSLGHDALAKLAAQWDEELSRGARLRKMVTAFCIVSAVALVMLLLFLQARFERSFAVTARDEATAAKLKAERARDEADVAKQRAMQARDEATTAKLAAEQARDDADQSKRRAELARDEANATVDKYFTEVANDTLLNAPGMQELRRKLLSAAHDHYVKLVEQRANDAKATAGQAIAYFNLGRISVVEENYQEAIKFFGMAREIQQNDPALTTQYADTLNSLGIVYQKLDRYNEALDHYRQAARQREQLVAGREEELLDANAAATEADERLLRMERELQLASVLMNIGLTLTEMRPADFEVVSSEVRDYLTSPSTTDLRSAVDFFNEANEIRASALPVLQSMLDAEPESNTLRQRQNLLCRSLAKGFFSKALFTGRRSKDYSVTEQHYNQAIDYFRKALEVSPDDLESQFVLAICHRAYGESNYRRDTEKAREQFQKSEALLERLVYFNPDVPRYQRELVGLSVSYQHLGIAQYHADRDNLSSPLQNLRSSEAILADLDSKFPNEHSDRLAEIRRMIRRFHSYELYKLRILVQNERYAQGEAFAEQLGHEHWGNGSILNQIAWMILTEVPAEVRNLSQALRFARRASSLQDDSDPATLDTLARVYCERGEMRQAVRWQKRAIEVATESQRDQFVEQLRLYEAAARVDEPSADQGNEPASDKNGAGVASGTPSASEARADENPP